MEKNNAFGDMPDAVKRFLDGRSLAETFKLKPKNWFVVSQMLRLGTERKVYELLYRRNLSLLVAKGFRRFIVGDAPVVIFDKMHDGSPNRIGGFASPTAEFTFPLSANVLLHLSHQAPPGVFNIHDEDVREFNRRAIVWADRFLFAESFDALTLSDIIALEGRRAGFSTDNLEADDGIYTISRMTSVHPDLLAK